MNSARAVAVSVAAVLFSSFANAQCPFPVVDKVTLSPTWMDERFGTSLAYENGLLAIGAPGRDERGAVRLYERLGTDWVFRNELQPIFVLTDEEFGNSLAMDDGFLFAAANARVVFDGSVFVYENVAGSWIFRQELIDVAGTANAFGTHVVADGGLVVVSDSANQIFTFEQSGNQWVQTHQMATPAGAIALNGDVLVTSDQASEAIVWRWDGQSWNLEQTLPAPNGFDLYGYAVAVKGDLMLLSRSQIASNQGSVCVFEFDGVEWICQQEVQRSPPAATDDYGAAIAMGNDEFFVSSPSDMFLDAAVSMYAKDNGTWVHRAEIQRPTKDFSNASFGRSLVVADDSVVVGDPDDDERSLVSSSGAAWFLRRTAIGFALEPEAASFDETVTLSSCNSAPGTPFLLVVTDIGGTPFFLRILLGVTDQNGAMDFQFQLPLLSGGLDVDFTLFAFPLDGGISTSTVTLTTE